MNRPKLFKALRITWSVGWGAIAVLFVVFWVRSSWRWVEVFAVPITTSRVIGFCTVPGSIGIVIDPNWGIPPWSSGRNPTDEWLALGGYPHSRVWGFFGVQAVAVIIPFWFSLLVAAILAALPWLPYRFSLRTLLIATTLIAVVLGMIVWMSRAG